MSDTGRITIYDKVQLRAPRVESSVPTQYRLARSNGNLILQGCYYWHEGPAYGYEWRDIPTIDIDQQEVTNA